MFDRLFGQIGELAIFAALAMIFGIIKTIVQPTARSLQTYITVLVVSVPVGVLAGGLALEYGFGDYTALAMASIASLLGEGIVRGLLDNREFIGRAINNLVDKYTK